MSAPVLKISELAYKVGRFALPLSHLEIEAGSYTVLLGPSGSGKSVLLELIAGLRRPQSGTIYLDGKEITTLPPAERSVGLLFQDYALFPHLSIFQNIGYTLRLRRIPKEAIRQQVVDLAREFGIESLLHRTPDTLSGGEQQRVALARTLIARPRLLLLDEPLSALDAHIRKTSRTFLKQINRSGQTIIHVTHDRQEATALATSIQHQIHITT